MKKLLVILAVWSLSGCALLDAWNMARFDNNEYMLINRVRTQANLGAAKCGKPEVVEDFFASVFIFGTYIKNTVGVNVKCNFNLWHATHCGSDTF